MGKTGSFIKLDRGLKANALWLEKPFSKGQAWVDLLLLAQGVDKDKQYRGKVQKQKSGVVYTSIIYLSNRWGWYRAKVYRFLEQLVSLRMVEIQGWTRNDTQNESLNSTKNSTTNGTIITIENWAFYQHDVANNSTKNESLNDTPNNTSNDTHNRKHTEKAYRESKQKKKGRSAPDSPSGRPERGTDEFRNQSHLLLTMEEGEADDIPVGYRAMFKTFAEYWRYRNQ